MIYTTKQTIIIIFHNIYNICVYTCNYFQLLMYDNFRNLILSTLNWLDSHKNSKYSNI